MNLSEPDETLPPKSVTSTDAKETQDLNPAIVDTADFSFDPDATATFQTSPPGKHFPSSFSLQIPGYEIVKELGRGAMGVVYAARQIRADRLVALKVMLHIEHAEAREIKRFAIEAQSAARLQHPNIVQVYEVGEFKGNPFFTLEFVKGGTLASKISKNLLPHGEVASVMLTLSRATEFAHSNGIVHRDLKPANILLDENGQPKIADFGLARRTEDTNHITRDGTIVGTPSYMAPEQAAGDVDAIGPLSDVYSLGAILYELLTGRPPFKGATIWEVIRQVRSTDPSPPSQLQLGIPADLETICLKCLQKDPAKRYASSKHLADDIQRHINNEPILARPIGQFERIVRLCKRHPREAILVGSIAALLIALLSFATYTANRFRSDRDKIASQVDKIGKQRDEIAKEKGISDERLELYRNTVSTFVNRLPRLLEGSPLAAGTKQEVTKMMNEILVDSGDSGQVGSSNLWGQMGTKLRQAESVFAEALASGRNSDSGKTKYATAEELFREAEEMANLAQKDEPDRAKAASNLSIVIARSAQCQFSSHPEKWKELVPRFLESIKLASEAVEASQESAPSSIAEYKSKQAERAYQYSKFLITVNPRDAKYQQKCIDYLNEAAKTQAEIVADQSLPFSFIEDVRNNLGMIFSSLAGIYRAQNNFEQTRSAYESAVENFQRLAEENPNRPSHLKNRAITCAAYGEYLLLAKADPELVAKQYTAAQESLRALLRSPEVVLLEQNGTAMNEYALGLNARRAGRQQEAKQHFQLAAAVREQAYRESLQGSIETPTSLSHLVFCALCQARAGLVNETNNSVQLMVGASQNSDIELPQQTRIDLLQTSAACMGIIAEGLAAENSNISKSYFDRAIRILEKAIETGYQDAGYLQTDPDFEWLSSRQDVLDKIVAKMKPSEKSK